MREVGIKDGEDPATAEESLFGRRSRYGRATQSGGVRTSTIANAMRADAASAIDRHRSKWVSTTPDRPQRL